MFYRSPQTWRQARKGNRWRRHNYSQSGWYFVTICTRFMSSWFGEIKHGQMEFNDMGTIAYRQWLQIPTHYINVMIDEFIVMPNHVHGIIRIVNHGDVSHVGAARVVGAAHVRPLRYMI